MRNKKEIEIEKAHKKWRKSLDKLYDLIEEGGRLSEEWEENIHKMCKAREELVKTRKKRVKSV